MDKKKAQQEIAGFVLIVVIVMIGLMVFLVISLRTPADQIDSKEVDDILSSIMRHTTDCAISYEPEYDTFEDLFKSCQEKKTCSNLKVPACDYLNETLTDVLESMMKSISDVSAYEFTLFPKEGGEGLILISQGNCTGEVNGAQRAIPRADLVINMQTCKQI